MKSGIGSTFKNCLCRVYYTHEEGSESQGQT